MTLKSFLLRLSFCLAPLVFFSAWAMPPCNDAFLKVLKSKNYKTIVARLGPGKVMEHGELFVWHVNEFKLFAGRIGQDMGMMVEPVGVRPPKQFTQALDKKDIKHPEELIALLGQPTIKMPIGYFRWQCRQQNNQVKSYYLTIDGRGYIFYEYFSYVNPNKT